MNRVSAIFSRQYPDLVFFLIGLVLTFCLLWPLLAAPYFSHHDDVQTIRLYEMNKCFQDGQIPCRWVPDLGGLYGYPLFNYYGPLPYYFGEIIYSLTNSLLVSAKMMFGFSFVGSYVFMFLLGRKLWGGPGGSLTAIFYVYAPYHAVDFYVRGAMGELWGLMFYPAILWAILRLRTETRLLNGLLLAIFSAFLILSHNLSAMIFGPVVLIFTGVLFFTKYEHIYYSKIRFIELYLFGIGLGLLISSFYWLPVLSEKNLVHVETTTYGYFSYTEHFKGFRKLFLERMWGWGASVREIPGGAKDGLSFQIGIVHLIGLIVGIAGFAKLWQKSKSLGVMFGFFGLVFVGAVLIIHPWSLAIWQLIEPLKFLQFPWRFLGIVIMAVSILSGSLFIYLHQKYQLIVWLIMVIAVVVANFGYFRPEKFFNISDADLLKNPRWEVSIKRSIFDYLPIYAEAPPAELATSRYTLLIGDTTVRDFQQGSDWIKFNAETKTHTIIQLSQYYFPDWRVFVDGKEVVTQHVNKLGLITFLLGEGTHTVEARLFNTQVRTVSNLMSVFGGLIFVGLLFFQPRKLRKWIGYYLRRLNG